MEITARWLREAGLVPAVAKAKEDLP
jgi:hypothetical protein